MNLESWYAGGNTSIVDELKVFYRREGTGDPLTCIHGFPSSSWDFDPIWSKLASRFDTIAIDLIGLGRSEKPSKALPVSLQADTIEKLLLSLGIQESHILAHDLGDTVAQELLARQLEKSCAIEWKSCVLMNGGIFPETHQALLIQKLLISPLGQLIARISSRKTLRKSMTNIFSKSHPPTEDFIDGTWLLMTENHGLSMIPRLIRYMRERRINRQRWVEPLEKNVIPIRLIDGVVDPVSGAHMADRFEEVVPEADVVRLNNSGHYPHIETPDQVVSAFFEFHNNLK